MSYEPEQRKKLIELRAEGVTFDAAALQARQSTLTLPQRAQNHLRGPQTPLTGQKQGKRADIPEAQASPAAKKAPLAAAPPIAAEKNFKNPTETQPPPDGRPGNPHLVSEIP